jgi:nickel/cobalt tolerance cation efflux system protein
VQVRTGRAPGDADGAGVNLAHLDGELSDQAMKDLPAAIAELRNAFLKLPGVAPNIGGFISHRMDEVLSVVRSAIAIKIYGPDLVELRRIGEQVRGAIEPIQQVQIATVGQVVSDGTDRTDVVVMLPEDSRNNLDALRAIPIATPADTMLPLGSFARTVVADIQNTIDSKIKRPSGYLIRYGGQFESEERATANLLLVDNYNRRHAEGMELKEVIRAGSLQRLNAILMTALTSALGTLPLALAFGAGNEILQPLAIVVLGGLITATLLTLLVLPALYARFGRWLLPRATVEA